MDVEAADQTILFAGELDDPWVGLIVRTPKPPSTSIDVHNVGRGVSPAKDNWPNEANLPARLCKRGEQDNRLGTLSVPSAEPTGPAAWRCARDCQATAGKRDRSAGERAAKALRRARVEVRNHRFLTFLQLAEFDFSFLAGHRHQTAEQPQSDFCGRLHPFGRGECDRLASAANR